MCSPMSRQSERPVLSRVQRSVDESPFSTGSRTLGSSFSGLFTRIEMGHLHLLAWEGTSRSRGSGSMFASHRSYASGGRMTGMRSWILPTSSFAAVVMMQNVRIHSSVFGIFQFSQMAASANGSPDFMAMAYGCFGLLPLDGFPFEEFVDGEQATTAPGVGITECWRATRQSLLWR